MTQRRGHFVRYMAIAAIFCLIAVIYLGRLFYIQFSGDYTAGSDDTTTRRVTVQAVRGEIYDRNGNALVTNRYSYDLTLSYSSLMSCGLRQSNDTCLHLIRALNASGESEIHVEKYFPFSGIYPDYVFSQEATDADSIPYYRLRKVLKEIGLDADASPSEIVKYYTSTYDLLATDADGKRLYTDGEVDRILRLRYDMDAQSFKANGEYTFAADAPLSMLTYVKELSLSGVHFKVNAERVYQYPGYASHILGTVGPIWASEWDYYNEQGYQMNAIVGKSGCEYAFESYLHGSDGLLEIEEDAAGNVLSVETLREPIAGNDVYLTIDIDLQTAAEDGLAENAELIRNRANGYAELGAECESGAAVVMNPDTFDVLAIASYPTYDLSTYGVDYNDLLRDPNNPLFNRALGGLFAPGSTYKLGVAVAALSEGLISSSSTISCTGKYNYYADYRPACSTYPHDTSHLNVVQAIADSCNCFFYDVGRRLGIDKVNDYMRGFGIGQKTGLELGGEIGVLASPEYRQEVGGEPWTDGLTLSAAIGQSDNLSSPLQLACYISTLVGGGTRYSAHLLDRVYAFGSDEPSFVYRQGEDTILSQVEISDAVLSSVLNGMRAVVRDNGIIDNYINDNIPVPVGGKTGTAQNSSGCDNALFVAAAPYNDPDLVISVVLEKGYSGSYASFTAARVLEAYYEKYPVSESDG